MRSANTVHPTMVQTVLEARVPVEQEETLRTGYARLGEGQLPEGLVRSQLIRDTKDPGVWRLETLWRSREALEAMRQHGTPGGLLLFREIGVEPTLAIYEVVAAIPE